MNFNVAGKEPRLHCMMLHAAFSEVTLSLEWIVSTTERYLKLAEVDIQWNQRM
jgi:hypothetical protein